MLWVIVFVAIAVGGLAMLAGYAVWLTRKTRDLLSEVGVLMGRALELGDLLAQIQGPPSSGRAQPAHRVHEQDESNDGRVVDDDLMGDRAT